MTRTPPETHDELVANIVDAWDAASDADRQAGRTWYPRAGAIIESLAAWSGLDRERMAAVVAALSPRNPWAWNVQDAAAVAYAAVNGLPAPKVTTFNANRDRAWAIATGGQDWKSTALKVRSFVANMTGDISAVTVDVWAVKVATRGKRSEVRSDADYHAIRQAYRAAALVVDESPRDLQAAVWIAAQSAGLASSRRGRHDLTMKRGTLAIVAALLTGSASNCPGWNVYAGSCQLQRGHKGSHVDRYGDAFRATPKKKS